MMEPPVDAALTHTHFEAAPRGAAVGIGATGSALMERVEFVRVGAMLLRTETGAGNADGNERC